MPERRTQLRNFNAVSLRLSYGYESNRVSRNSAQRFGNARLKAFVKRQLSTIRQQSGAKTKIILYLTVMPTQYWTLTTNSAAASRQEKLAQNRSAEPKSTSRHRMPALTKHGYFVLYSRVYGHCAAIFGRRRSDFLGKRKAQYLQASLRNLSGVI